MIAVCIPAHNEEADIARCLRSVQAASSHPGLLGEPVLCVVGLDRCTDATADIARSWGALTVEVRGGTVGAARAAAADVALQAGARWLACTDADTQVPGDWLHAQLACGADVFCGVVTVDDWAAYPDGMANLFTGPQAMRDGHPHVHGANLGVSAAAYRSVGGFPALACSEDVAFVSALARAGFTVARRCTPAVVTSARKHARAVGGFSDYLKGLERVLLEGSMPSVA